MKIGDLVRVYRHGAIGIIADIFDDLDPENPWVKVMFTSPKQTYQWCKVSGIEIIKERGHKDPLRGNNVSGSL